MPFAPGTLSKVVYFGGGGVAPAGGSGALSAIQVYNAVTYGVPSNATDIVATLTTLVTTTIAGQRATLYFPPGTYGFASDFTFPENIRVWLAKGATFKALNAGRTLHILGENLDASPDLIFDQSAFSFTVDFGGVFGAGVTEVRPEWWGAFNDGTNAAITSAAFVSAYKTGMNIRIGRGVYLVNPNVIATDATGAPLYIEGLGREISRIQIAAGAGVGISIGTLAASEGSHLRHFFLRGDVTNDGGIQLGNGANYAGFIGLEDLRIDNFQKVGAFGLGLYTCQEVDVHNCNILQNYNNVHRPNSGFCTSTVFRGQKGSNRLATNIGVNLVGPVADITFHQQVFESCFKQAVFANGFQIIITIADCYFEANNTQGTAGRAQCDLSGGSAAALCRAVLQRNHWHILQTVGIHLRLDFSYAIVEENDGFQSMATPILTTANSVAIFRLNFDANIGDMIAVIRGLVGYGTSVTIENELDAGGRLTMTGNRRLDNVHFNSTQAALPAVALQGAPINVGTGGTVTLDAGSTDRVGSITVVTGSGAWAAGPLALITFMRPYNIAPRMTLTPRDAASKAADITNRIFTNYPDATGFYLQVGVAFAVAGATYHFDYTCEQAG